MTDPAAPSTRLSATLVGEHFRFRCARLLRYGMTPPSQRDSEAIPLPEPPPGAGVLLRVGRRWERRATERAVARFGESRTRFAGWKHDGSPGALGWPEVLATLTNPGDTALLVQPTLALSDSGAFRRRYGIPEQVEIAPAQPDLLRVRRGADGRAVLGVIDLKGSRRPHPQHFAQVAFYGMLLEEICRSEALPVVSDPQWGWVWTRGSKGPRRFPRAAYAFHVERFLRNQLTQIASRPASDAGWHVGPSCGGCRYTAHCRAEADRTDDLARVMGITPVAKELLHGRGVRTVRQLATNLRRDTFTGCHALEAGEPRLRKQAQALAWNKVLGLDDHTSLIGSGERVRAIVTAAAEPVHGLCYAVGLRIEGPGGISGSWAWTTDAPTPSAERDTAAGLLERLCPALAAAELDRGRKGDGSPLAVFVAEPGELRVLRELLQRHLEAPELRGRVAQVLDALAPPGGGASPVVVLTDAVAATWALPLAYTYDLDGIAGVLAGPHTAVVSQPGASSGWDRIHRAWRRRDGAAEVRQTIADATQQRLARAEAAIAAIRERAGRRGRNRPRFRASPAAAEGPLRDPALESLRVFTRLEAATAEAATRALYALSPTDRARRWECIRGMELVERRPDGHLVFEFDPECRDAKFRPGDFALVLTNEGADTLQRLAGEPWLRRRLMVELIEYDLSTSLPRVVLSPGSGIARAEADGLLHLDRRCVLDRAGVDFATGRLLRTLASLDAEKNTAALELLRGIVPRPQPLDGANVKRRLLERAACHREARILNAEQEQAWSAVFDQGMSLVWGPPGTGKTYLLAWMILGIAAGMKRSGAPCRIGVCAATHRAIANLLGRIRAEAPGADVVLRVAKLQGSGSETDDELRGQGVEVVPDAALPELLTAAEENGEPLVVGCTTWSLWKQMRALEGGADADPVHPCFDLVVIDEASQMTVPQSLIALSALRAGGRVVLGGDHQQLPPVLQGRYGADSPTLWGSAFAYFARLAPTYQLRESRRMNEALVAYPRMLFYPGFYSHTPARKITLGPSTSAAGPDDELLARLFLAPEDVVVLCTYRGVRAAARNPWEANLAARLVRLLRQRMRDPSGDAPYTAERFVSEGVAVLAPHRAQNAAILAELQQAGWAAEELPTVDTVERMQGNEREVIVVSYGVADREYAEAEADFLLDPRRFNVAVTRARSKVIVLLSEDTLDALPYDEEVAAASMALKGYAAHCSHAVCDVELPGAADGSAVPATLRYRRLGAANDLDTSQHDG